MFLYKKVGITDSEGNCELFEWSLVFFFVASYFFTSQFTDMTSLPVVEQEDEDEEQSGTLLEEDKTDESEAEDEARLQLQTDREAAWVDEDDELDEE